MKCVTRHNSLQTGNHNTRHALTTAGHLEEVVHSTFFEHASFELHKLVGDHDGEERLVMGIDGYVECSCLEQDNYAMQNWHISG